MLRFLLLFVIVLVVHPMYTQGETTLNSDVSWSKLQTELAAVKLSNQYLSDSLSTLQEKLQNEIYTQEEYLNHRRNRFFLLTGGLIAFMLSIGLWSRLRYIQKTKKALETQKLKAEQSEQFEQEFLANMSHEIRTPLHAILGMTNLALDTNLDEKQSKYLKAVQHSSENLLVLINDILDLSKIEAGELSLEQIPFHLSDVLNQVYDTLRFKAEEKGLNFNINLDDDVPDFISGDPSRLLQILINLCGNAIKFTSRGSVELRIQKVKDSNATLLFRIIDTGIGIPAHELDRLFKNFHQLDASTSRKYGGSGLGLSISKSLVDMQGGHIEVVSELNKGSTFSFTLPYSLVNDQEIQHLKKAKHPENSNLNGIRILIAEDNAYNGIVIHDTLEHLIDEVDITLVTNGKEALEELNQKEFDIILMDAQMPIMDGIEATEHIKTQISNPISKIPIIALTASVFHADIQKCMQAGMVDYIPKPFKRDQLLSTLLKYYANENKAKTDSDPKERARNIEKLPSSKNLNTITDLEFLNEFCEGDPVRIQKYIDMYLDVTPQNIEKLNALFRQREMDKLSKCLHQMLPHFQFMGMTQTWELSKTLEQLSKSNPSSPDLKLGLNKLISFCKGSYKELSNHRYT